MRVMSPKPTILARNLFRQLFSAEELSNHSLFGKKSNANRGRETLPEIDSVRRDAVINFILKDEGFGEAPETGNPAADKVFIKAKKTLKNELRKTLSEFLREEKAKARDGNNQ
ncbi:uncharacterized protein LOC118436770 [Folsomia candida]|nr:uncharacterized protein LOC118436770 [Folsomia candida]